VNDLRSLERIVSYKSWSHASCHDRLLGFLVEIVQNIESGERTKVVLPSKCPEVCSRT
jgi:hypothetical protein